MGLDPKYITEVQNYLKEKIQKDLKNSVETRLQQNLPNSVKHDDIVKIENDIYNDLNKNLIIYINNDLKSILSKDLSKTNLTDIQTSIVNDIKNKIKNDTEKTINNEISKKFGSSINKDTIKKISESVKNDMIDNIDPDVRESIQIYYPLVIKTVYGFNVDDLDNIRKLVIESINLDTYIEDTPKIIVDDLLLMLDYLSRLLALNLENVDKDLKKYFDGEFEKVKKELTDTLSLKSNVLYDIYVKHAQLADDSKKFNGKSIDEFILYMMKNYVNPATVDNTLKFNDKTYRQVMTDIKDNLKVDNASHSDDSSLFDGKDYKTVKNDIVTEMKNSEHNITMDQVKENVEGSWTAYKSKDSNKLEGKTIDEIMDTVSKNATVTNAKNFNGKSEDDWKKIINNDVRNLQTHLESGSVIPKTSETVQKINGIKVENYDKHIRSLSDEEFQTLIKKTNKIDNHLITPKRGADNIPVADSNGYLNSWIYQGAGSNLDADTIDGHDVSLVSKKDSIPLSDSHGKIDSNWLKNGKGSGINADTIREYAPSYNQQENSIVVSNDDGYIDSKYIKQGKNSKFDADTLRGHIPAHSVNSDGLVSRDHNGTLSSLSYAAETGKNQGFMFAKFDYEKDLITEKTLNLTCDNKYNLQVSSENKNSRILNNNNIIDQYNYQIIEDDKTLDEFSYNLIDTSSKEITVTLPKNPQLFMKIGIVDRKNTFHINKCTLKSGDDNVKINNIGSQIELVDKNTSFKLLYDASNNNWLII